MAEAAAYKKLKKTYFEMAGFELSDDQTLVAILDPDGLVCIYPVSTILMDGAAEEKFVIEAFKDLLVSRKMKKEAVT